MITHKKIENDSFVEQYVRGQLSAEDRRAFQEHFLNCDECFGNLLMTERLIAGVRHAAETGSLSRVASQDTPSAAWLRWIKPAMVLGAAACIVLAATCGWLLLVRIPRLNREIAQERRAREALEQRKQLENDGPRLKEQSPLQTQRQTNDQQTPQPAGENKRPPDNRSLELLAANVPLVILQATRDSQEPNELKLPPGVQRYQLWIEVGPRTQFHNFRIEVLGSDGRVVKTVSGLKRNSRNAVTATLPTQGFSDGSYLVRLFGLKQNQSTLAGEYKLRVERK
jgi:hypothetical protein